MSDLELRAREASEVLPPSELHGLVCGLAAAAPTAFSMTELVQLVGADALTDETSVGAFVSDTLEVMFSPDMDFQPLVADDEEELGVRLASLAEWCAGFLGGFGAGVTARSPDGPEGASKLPLDVQEIVRDFASISGLDDDVDGDEQDENSFMELFEYVRVAAVLAMTLMAEREEGGTDGGLDEDIR